MGVSFNYFLLRFSLLRFLVGSRHFGNTGVLETRSFSRNLKSHPSIVTFKIGILFSKYIGNIFIAFFLIKLWELSLYFWKAMFLQLQSLTFENILFSLNNYLLMTNGLSLLTTYFSEYQTCIGISKAADYIFQISSYFY